MEKHELTQYADCLLKRAMRKTQNIADAEDLAGDTLIAALEAISCGNKINDPKGWLFTVLDRRYYDMLRRKYRRPAVSIDVDDEMVSSPAEETERSEDAENIRRCLGSLTRLYREVSVRYYMHGESIKQISKSLGIPENTVKSRLDTGRKHMRKEFDMENYTKQSYEPETLLLSFSGKMGMDGEPLSVVGNRKIEMNLLILAYEKPVTVPELAKAIGISSAYIEPIVDALVDGELMKRVSDRVYTDFIIFTRKDRTANIALEKSIADKHYKEIWSIVEKGLEELRSQAFYISQPQYARQKLESFFAVRTVQNAVGNIRNEAAGFMPFENYTDRKNGGKWHAMGNRITSDKNETDIYSISGEATEALEDYCGKRSLVKCEYDCALGKTRSGYGHYGVLPWQMDSHEVLKLLYAVHSHREADLPIINMHCFDNIDGLIELGLLGRENGSVINTVPVISSDDRWKLYEISEKYDTDISENFRNEFMKLMKNPVTLPAHLRSVPNWQRYMWCCSSLPMMIILNAHDNGLFLKGTDLKKSPVPPMFIAEE